MSDSSLLHAFAGAGAGCASLAITYPLYARMVRQQVAEKPTLASIQADAVKALEAAPGFIERELSPAALQRHFAGLPAALAAITVQSGVYYYFFQLFKNVHNISTSPLGNILVGTEAGVATVLLTNPLWVLNSRQLTKGATGRNVSFIESFRLLVVEEGLAGVYSGLGPALALVSSPALQFAAYEYLKALVARFRGAAGVSPLDFFLLGAVSKIIATLITYPIFTLKSQLQKDNSPYAKDGLLAGFIRCIRDMVTSPEGVASLYRGLKAKILQTGLTAAFLFVIREQLVAMLTKWTEASAVAKLAVAVAK